MIDVLRGKQTDKVAQHGHQALSTFGVGADLSEAQWRSVLRQLIALGYLKTEGEYNTLELDASAQRLEALERGLAFERAGYYSALNGLLVSGAGSLEQQRPEVFLHWHELVPSDGSDERLLNATVARLFLDRIDEALPDATRLVRMATLAPNLRARLAGTAVFALSGAKRFEAADLFAEQLQGLIADLKPLEAGFAWRRLASVAYMRGHFEETEQHFHAALAAFGQAEPSAMRTSAETQLKANLYSVALDVRGEIEGPLAGQLELLEHGGLDDLTQVTLRQNAAVSLALLNEVDAAVAQLKIALPLTSAYGKLLIETMLAYFTRDLAESLAARTVHIPRAVVGA